MEDNQSAAAPQSPGAATLLTPWNAPDLFPPRPAGSEYGYRANGVNRPVAPGELQQRVAAEAPREERVDLVWTPQTPYMVPPAEVPFLALPAAERTRADLKFNLKNSLFALVVWSTLVLLAHRSKHSTQLYLIFLLMLGVVPAVQDLWGLWRLSRSPETYAREQAATLRYQIWLGLRRGFAMYVVAGCLVVVFLCQLLPPGGPYSMGSAIDHSIKTAGLIKAAARDNHEWWRLATCTLMHGSIIHILFNCVALIALGRLIEVHGHWAFVFIVFVFAAICGSIASMVLLPNVPTVGASGGIMGMIGFLAVMGYRRRKVLPTGFLKWIVISIALTAGSGIVVPNIDNAAHGGGLLGGILLGFIYVSRRSIALRLTPSKAARAAGFVAAGLLILLTVWTSLRLVAGIKAKRLASPGLICFPASTYKWAYYSEDLRGQLPSDFRYL